MTSRTLPFLVIACILASCGLAHFELSRDVPEQQVPGSPVGGLLGSVGVPVPIDVDLEAETESRHTGPVQHVRLDALSWTRRWT